MVSPWYLKGLENSIHSALSLLIVNAATIRSDLSSITSPTIPFHCFVSVPFTYINERKKIFELSLWQITIIRENQTHQSLSKEKARKCVPVRQEGLEVPSIGKIILRVRNQVDKKFPEIKFGSFSAHLSKMKITERIEKRNNQKIIEFWVYFARNLSGWLARRDFGENIERFSWRNWDLRSKRKRSCLSFSF